MIANSTVKLHQDSSLLEVSFPDGFNSMLSLEILRVYSPSLAIYCEHTQLPVLVTDKVFVNLHSIEEIANEGLRLIFDDGHDSGVFSWSYLYRLAKNQDQLWSSYIERLGVASKNKRQLLNVIVEYSAQLH